ncbi:MAG: SMC-Scp complex subunit ScpB [Planctomycetes bacterium]|nr:SMC-Scp complex subunit ScpB [Planctomycetota bacterium]
MEIQEIAEQPEAAAFAPEPAEVPCADQTLESRVEAVLLSVSRPVSEAKLVEFLGLESAGSKDKAATALVRQAIDKLNSEYAASARSFRVERLAGGWQLLTLGKFAPLLTRVHGDRQQGRLSPAALDTLAIIAYRQPVLRSELEAVRGVACGDVLRGLMERRLVRITGRAEELGRPMLYGTTTEFLRVFGISRIEDLPQARELRNPNV